MGSREGEESRQRKSAGRCWLVRRRWRESFLQQCFRSAFCSARERVSLCGFFYERPGAFRNRIFSAIVRSKVRASAGAYERNDRRPSVFMFAVRGSGATRIIVVRGTQRARTPPPSASNNRASGKRARPVSLVPSWGSTVARCRGETCFGLFERLSVLCSPRSVLAYALARCGPLRRIRGSEGLRAKGQNGPFKRTQPIQGSCLDM